MKIVHVTFDYELFFGEKVGSVEHCLIHPTNELIKISDETGAKFTFFIDVGYLIKLKEFSIKFPELKSDLVRVEGQLKILKEQGHSLQLHIHPHWEDSYYDGNKWIVKSERYRLQSFSEAEIVGIVARYTGALRAIAGEDVIAYRAGGWCIQPFSKIKDALESCGIKIDSTIYRGGRISTSTHYFDFRGASSKERWNFSSDPIVEDKSGNWLEIPISSMWISPFFYWMFTFVRVI